MFTCSSIWLALAGDSRKNTESTQSIEQKVEVGVKVVEKKTVRLAVKRQARTFVNLGNGSCAVVVGDVDGGVDNNSRHVPAINSGASETCTVVDAAKKREGELVEWGSVSCRLRDIYLTTNLKLESRSRRRVCYFYQRLNKCRKVSVAYFWV